MRKNTKKLCIRLLIYAIIIAVGVAYLVFIRNGDGLCLIYRFFKKPCLSCGATRALLSILRGDFASAVHSHIIFTAAFYPIAAIVLTQDLFICIWRIVKKNNTPSLLEYAINPKLRRELIQSGGAALGQNTKGNGEG